MVVEIVDSLSQFVRFCPFLFRKNEMRGSFYFLIIGSQNINLTFINANSILSNLPRSISLCQRALWNSHLVGGGAYFVGKYKWIKDKLNRNVQQPFLPVGSNWCRGWKMSKSIISPLYPAVFALWMRGILSEKILLASK